MPDEQSEIDAGRPGVQVDAGEVFSALPVGAEGHFLLYFYSVVAQILIHLRLLEQSQQEQKYSRQFSFLTGYQAALNAYQPAELAPAEQGDWWDTQLVRWEAVHSQHLPLRALAVEAGLSREEVRMLVAVGLVEEDIRFGALFAALQEPLVARRPSLGVLGWLLGQPASPLTDAWQACHALLDAGLLQIENRSDPRAEWLLRVQPALWDAIRGQLCQQPAPGLRWQPASDFPQPGELILPAALLEQILRIPDLLASAQITALALRGMTGCGRRTTLGAMARMLGRDILLWEASSPNDDTWRLLGPLATLTGAMPLLRCSPGPGETLDLPLLPGYSGPVGLTLGRSGGLKGPLLEHALSLTLPSPDREARRRFWQDAVSNHTARKPIRENITILPLHTAIDVTPAPLAKIAAMAPIGEHTSESAAPLVSIDAGSLEEIATRFLLTGGYIARTAALAQTYALLAQRPGILPLDVQQATRSLNRQALETLATALEPAHGWGDLVVSASTAGELYTLEARCRGREALCQHAGPALSSSLNRGVRVLFSGPSGTGKTLAARALAAALQMDLYRVDLAAVVNKYIGETERNLNLVLSRAEELDVVLLLDEGDALMTNRTDVRNANDRYANLETNYLLQRLENYEGIVVITTNAGSRIDTAFARRLDVIIDFAPPEASERWLIWQAHLPQTHTVGPAFLEEVAGRCVLTGGQIRNAALHATLLALHDHSSVDDAQLEAAVQREYRKAGASCPLHPGPAARGQVEQLRRLAAELG